MRFDMQEQVMVIKREVLDAVGSFQGFSSDTQKIESILDSKNISFMPRDEMEKDPSYKQIIPYCVFGFFKEGVPYLFSYTRGSKGGENRLHAKKSIGVGGHINPIDSSNISDGNISNVYENGMLREIREEVGIYVSFYRKTIGLVNDDSNDVGKVHLGVVELFELEKGLLASNDDSLEDGLFVPLEDILKDKNSYENWSRLVLEYIDGHINNK
jgi:predicted NUDIX family phosphoesterase